MLTLFLQLKMNYKPNINAVNTAFVIINVLDEKSWTVV